MANCVVVLQSQRGCVHEPRVARNELPWVIVIYISQPQRGCGECRAQTETEWPQPRCGWKFFADGTQGSACRATLGFVTESRWDSRFANNLKGIATIGPRLTCNSYLGLGLYPRNTSCGSGESLQKVKRCCSLVASSKRCSVPAATNRRLFASNGSHLL